MDIAALGTAPISTEQVAGQDARYEPEYAEISAEIAKLGSITQVGAINWSQVASNGEIILANKSKDLQIAAYVAFAWQTLRGPEGLADGVELLLALFKTFWQEAFPPLARIRRRVNAFDWWHERAHMALEKESAAKEISQELATRLNDNLRELDQVAFELMSDVKPLRDLLEDVRRLPVEVTGQVEEDLSKSSSTVEEVTRDAAVSETTTQDTLVAESSPQEEAAQETSEPAAELQSVPESPKSEEESSPTITPDAPKPSESAISEFEIALKDFSSAGLRYALAAHAVNLQDPMPWRVIRLALWGRIQKLPPATNGETHISPPDQDRLAGLHKMLEAGKLDSLALACENLFAVSPFCLDLQFLADQALEGLGKNFAQARKVLREETSSFIKRLAEVENLTFDGGLAFAASPTKTWLKKLGSGVVSEVSLEPSQKGGSSSSFGEVLQKASQEAEAGSLKQALKLLEKACGDSPSDNLRLRNKELELLCAASEVDTAGLLAEILLQELEKYNVETWDINLAIEVLLAVRSAKGLLGDSEAVRSIQARIVRLRPSEALGWSF